MAALIAVVLAVIRPAPADGLIPPTEVTIHVPRSIAGLEFMPLLDQTLSGTLRLPVRIIPTDFDHGSLKPRSGPTQAIDLLRAFAATLPGVARLNTMHVLIVTDDIQLPPARFNFAVSHGAPDSAVRVMVVSLSRLMAWDLRRGVDPDPATTSARVFRLIIKNAARMSGLFDSDRCVMAFPDRLQALDAMPLSFCEPDLSRLVAAGLVRAPQELGGPADPGYSPGGAPR